jgi:hypothetical protein
MPVLDVMSFPRIQALRGAQHQSLKFPHSGSTVPRMRQDSCGPCVESPISQYSVLSAVILHGKLEAQIPTRSSRECGPRVNSEMLRLREV